MLQRHEFGAMGSRMLAIVDCAHEPALLQQVPAWFEGWEQVLSRFRSDSELSQLNLSTGAPTKVSETLWEVYMEAVGAEQMTSGLVTPLILPALLWAGYDRPFDALQRIQTGSSVSMRQLELVAEPLTPKKSTRLDDVKADRHGRSLFLPKGATLDFGGIAKGWAAEKAVRKLAVAGPALVSAGGDIAVSGPMADGEAWPIEVEDPFQKEAYVEMIYLERGGVATSGKDHRHWIQRGIAQHHIIDPRIGLPAESDILTATVIAPTAVQAEAYAKAVLISGSQAGLAWLDSDERLAGLLVLDNGQRLYSRNLERYL